MMTKDETITWARVILDLIYPRYCEGCSRRMDHALAGYICADCYHCIHFLVPDRQCQRCAKPLQGQPMSICSICREQKWYTDRCFALASYEGVLKTCIVKLKYHQALHLSATLAVIFRNRARQCLDLNQYDLLVPVPLHSRKYRERGFNQAFLLSNTLRPLRPNRRILKRVLYSEGQTLKTRLLRVQSVKHSFQVFKNRNLEGKRVLLVDDVLTTGATSNACARVLKEQGARSVDVLVLAKSI